MNKSIGKHVKVAIIGAGPAGYTAAIYASRAMLEPVLFEGMQPGGQLTITTDVENWPGETSIQGPDLMVNMKAQAEHVGTTIVQDLIVKANLKKRPFTLETGSGEIYIADTVIVATGAQAKWLGIPSEEAYKGYGVSACATCDGFFYRGKKVLVVGGGNTAVEEALFLTNFASEVTVIHRRDSFKAEKILQERLFKHPKVKVLWHTSLEEVVGEQNPPKVVAARLKNVNTGEIVSHDVSGIFIAIGHSPAVELFTGELKQKESGVLWTKPYSTKTNIKGVFAAGDVADDIFRQAVTSAGMGCMAALEAEKFLAGH